MFASTAITLPPPFANDLHHHPLRASSESARPQPSGGCNFLLVQPSAKSKICACQVYHHDRSAPGNVCDCGHPACFHVHSFGDKATDGANGMKIDTAEKLKKLEDLIAVERQERENDRREWQREMRSLQEALSPFYRTEGELQRRLMQVDARLDAITNEQQHITELITNSGNHDLARHRDIQSSSANNTPYGQVRTITSHSTDDVPGLTSGDDRSSTSSFSRHHTPSEAMPTLIEPESPRSSGILNLMSRPRSSMTSTYNVPKPVPHFQEEARSSGFLGVSTKHRYPAAVGHKRPHQTAASPPRGEQFDARPAKTSRHNMSQSRRDNTYQRPVLNLPPLRTTSSRALLRTTSHQGGNPSVSQNQQGSFHSLTQKNHAGHNLSSTSNASVPLMALDVLANVSTATTGLH